MELSKYARIGKAPFIKAIGIQKNHKEVIYTESQELDYAASGCFACDNYKNIDFYEFMPEEIQKEAKNRCKNCPCAVYKTVVHETCKSVNEKNIFGNAKRLKSIALKLLLIYHFASPDEHGLVRGLSPRELAGMLDCTVRSVKNANSVLQEYGYIMCSSDGLSKKRIQVILTEYETYSLPADKGGRGYATFNYECLEKLIQITDLNQLRIFLRAALDIDTNRNPEKELTVTQDYDFLRRFLPNYCKPGIIRHALSSVSELFSVAFDGDEEHIHLKMNPLCHGRRNYDKNVAQNTSLIEDYISSLDKAMDCINQSILTKIRPDEADASFLAQEGILTKTLTKLDKSLFVPFHLSAKEYKDLGVLCTTYTFDAVKNCIGYVYENYNSQFKVTSIGALIRTILHDKNNRQESSLFQTA